MPKSVNEVFRDFTRWTGDGLPNEPTGHPLPIGDPRSGLWNPPKADIRDALGGVFSSASSAATAAATAQYWANVAHVSRSTDPGEWRSFIGIDGERATITASGTYVLDATAFLPNITVAAGASDLSIELDVAGMVMGQTYAIYNIGLVGARVTLDCGAEYGFMGFGATPNAGLGTNRVFIDGGQVAYLCKVNVARIHISVQGDYWAAWDAGKKYRRAADGTYEVSYRHGASIAANSLSAVQSLPSGFDLTNAIVSAVTTQPRDSGTQAPASPCYVELMGTTNGLAANEFRLRNPNAGAFAHHSVITFTNVTRS